MNQELRAHEGARHTFVVTRGDDRRKVFQVQFLRRDGSVVVHFPYHAACDGIAAVGCVGSWGQAARVDLTRNGKITAHKVKFVHHPDGEAHFSQDGRVRTEIRKTAAPLTRDGVHVFTIHVEGFERFAMADEWPGSSKRSVVTMTCRPETTSVKIVAHWYAMSSILTRLGGRSHSPVIGPEVQTRNPSNRGRPGVLVRAPKGFPFHDHVLVLSSETMEPLDRERRVHVLMIGGFDGGKHSKEEGQDARFLGLMYPAANADELRARIGSIDL